VNTQELAAIARQRLADVPHRRRGDRGSPLAVPVPPVTIWHGANAACPDVQAGRTTRCLGHAQLPPEGPAEHCRNALIILRFSIEHDEPSIGNGCPAVAVPITSLARMQARLETALEQLEGGV